MLTDPLQSLFAEVRRCTLCAGQLPNPPRPVVRGSSTARLLIVGQAPGRKVHETGIPFNDPSGDRLRDWMGVDRETFYDESRIALLPMGFCYPGTGKGGDLPPPPLCATTWRGRLLAALPDIELTLVIGRYAQHWHLHAGLTRAPAVSATVMNWRHFWPEQMPLPHPSPRNIRWLRSNPWFEADVLPPLRRRIAGLLDDSSRGV